MKTDNSSHALHFADTARVVGIGMVVLNHFGGAAFPETRGFRVESLTAYLGVLGVALLFILSGYLLSRPFIMALLRGTPLPSTRDFYIKRFLRIYPLYFVAVVLVAALDVFRHVNLTPMVPMIVSHLALVHNFSIITAGGIEEPLWTMAVDAQFYLALPLIGILLVAIARDRRSTLWTTLFTIAIAAVSARLAVMLAHPTSAENFRSQIVYLKQAPEMGFSFAVGAAIALFEETGGVLRRRSPFLIVGVLIAMAHAISRTHPGHGLTYAIGFAVYDAVAAIAAGLIFIGLPRSRNGNAMIFAANISYAVYLFHYPVFAFVAGSLHPTGLARLAEVFASFVLFVIPFAWIMHIVVERPFLAMKARAFSRVPVRRMKAISES